MVLGDGWVGICEGRRRVLPGEAVLSCGYGGPPVGRRRKRETGEAGQGRWNSWGRQHRMELLWLQRLLAGCLAGWLQ